MTTSALARFRARQNRPTIIDVKWPMENPSFVFKVGRFAQAEQTEATFDANKLMTRRGIEKPRQDASDDERSVYQQEFMVALYYSLASYVKRHIKGWEHSPTDGEPISFTQANLDMLFGEMNFMERMELGLSYFLADQDDEKKKEPRTNTETAS